LIVRVDFVWALSFFIADRLAVERSERRSCWMMGRRRNIWKLGRGMKLWDARRKS
jgi:hypothetical protein